MYDFVFSGSDCSNADIVVSRTTNPSSIGGCGAEGSNPANNNLNSVIDLSDCSAQSTGALGTVEHELGHWLGLNDLGSQNCKSVMGGAVNACSNDPDQGTGTITSNDVSETVAYAAASASCTVNRNSTNQPDCDPSEDPNCPIACSDSSPACNNGSQAQCVNGYWSCGTACQGQNPGCSDGSGAQCVSGSWQCGTGCVGMVPPTCADGSEAACSYDGSGWQCGSVTTSQCNGGPPASLTCPSALVPQCTNGLWQCYCDVGLTPWCNYGAQPICTTDGWTCCTDDSSCPTGLTCQSGQCTCNTSCDNPLCDGYDYCACNPGDPSCGPPPCDPDNFNECDPSSCYFDFWMCWIDCECEGFCGDIAPIAIEPSGTSLPVDADPNLITPQQQVLPPGGAHPMCEVRPGLTGPQISMPPVYAAVDGIQTSLVERRIG